ncbi:MAG TPA: hypothetical protein VIC27_01660, partial [Ktedonobacterales bacterium]
YKAQIVAPLAAPAGAYSVTVIAREISDTIASATRSLRIERFPTPTLLSPTTHQPVSGAVAVQVTRWDPALRLIYGAPVGLLNWLGQWPLQGRPAQPIATLPGQVYLDGKPYSAATVRGSFNQAGARASAPLTVTPQGGGAFTTSFPAATSGAYTLTLDTQGAFQDSHGDLGVTTRAAQVTVVPATVLWQEVIAWAITLLYVALLVLLCLLIRYWWAPHPFGRLVSGDGGGGEEFARARRGAWALWQPSVVRSEHMGLGPGLRFLFGRGHRILVKGVGAGASDFRLGGERVTGQQVSATESTLTAHRGESSYIVSASSGDDEEEEGAARRAGLFRGRSRTDDDDEDADVRPRRGIGLGRRRAIDDDDDDYQPARRARRRSRASDADDNDDNDDNARPSRSARGSRRARDDDDDDAARSRSGRDARSRYADDDW